MSGIAYEEHEGLGQVPLEMPMEIGLGQVPLEMPMEIGRDHAALIDDHHISKIATSNGRINAKLFGLAAVASSA